jgi:hypothetical protein
MRNTSRRCCVINNTVSVPHALVLECRRQNDDNIFKTGNLPITPKETLEIYTFMEAADESKRKGGKSIQLKDVYDTHLKKANKIIQSLNLPS